MSVQVTDLYDSEKEKYSLSLLAGENGLTNSVSWVYLAEDFQNMSFLKGGELVITTGLFTEREISLIDFIRGLATHNCSGIILNIGKYIEPLDITDEILAFCNSCKIPLFTMPWEIHLVDIMQNYSRLLLHNTQSMEQLNGAFQGALYQDPLHKNILLTINQFGFSTVGDYRMIVIQSLSNTTRIIFSLNFLKFQYHLFEHENKYILIYSITPNGPSLNQVIEILLYGEGIKLGISNVIHSLTELRIGYKKACFSLATALLWNNTYTNFDDLGIFQILFCASDTDMLKDIYKQNLGVLEEFDMLHQSDYLDTLRVYLLSDCNLLETSSRMHTHRNTIIYRIKKIKELLRTELDNSKVKFNLLMAYYIKEYFTI